MVAQKQTDLRKPGSSKNELVNQLRNQIRQVETTGRADAGSRISSGCSAIDRLLPESGYERGTLVQWLTGGGQGADYISLLSAKQACDDGGALVVFDPEGQFYPPAAAAMGVNLDHLIILKSGNQGQPSGSKPSGFAQELDSDLLWSIDQALRCPAVAAVWGPMGRISERWFRRFQLSAESSGCLGFFVQPIQEVRQPSWADVQWLVADVARPSTHSASFPFRVDGPRAQKTRSSRELAEPTYDSLQTVRLQLVRCRGTQTGKTVNLSINTITGNVQVARRDYEQLRGQVHQEQCDPELGAKAGNGRSDFRSYGQRFATSRTGGRAS